MMSMNPYIQWVLYTVAAGCINALLVGGILLIRGGVQKVETVVSEHLPPAQAANVNAFLDTVDRLAESVVKDANSRLVNGLKSAGAFNPDVGAAIKKDAISTVMTNLGTLKEEGAAALGPLEPIIGQYIEKHVLAAKGQTSTNAKTPA